MGIAHAGVMPEPEVRALRAYRHYAVAPRLPESLAGLRTIAYNVWWTWNADAIELLRLRCTPSSGQPLSP